MTLQEQLKQTQNATIERMPQSIMKVFTDGVNDLKNSQLKSNSFRLGDQLQDVQLVNKDKESVWLSSFQNSEFLILNFYRGGWCSYCNMELRAYERLRKDFNAIGADILGISAEMPELSANTTTKNALTFPIVTDVDAQFMKTIGIVFQLDEATKKEYNNFGIDLRRNHANDKYELPVPAVYVIDKHMEIVFVHFNEDYMTRFEPAELLEILEKKSKATKRQ